MSVPDLDYPFKTAPNAAELIPVHKDVYWLRMPIPFSLNHINLWMIEGQSGWTIVDSGIQSEETKRNWESIFNSKLQGKDVEKVVATHMHPDHLGIAGWLCERWQVDLWMTRSEWLFAQIGADLAVKHQSAYAEHYMRLGVEKQVVENIAKMFSLYSNFIAPLPALYRRLAQDDHIEMGDHTWKVMIGYGHSPEHACFYCEDKNLLIGGDQLLPGITPSISVSVEEIDSDPLKAFLLSLEQFYDLPEDVLVLPSHQLPYRGVHTRIDQLKAHHQERCELLLDACKEPQSAFNLVDVLFSHRKLGPMDKIMALGETIAHANLLINEGALYRDLNNNQQYIFTR